MVLSSSDRRHPEDTDETSHERVHIIADFALLFSRDGDPAAESHAVLPVTEHEQ